MQRSELKPNEQEQHLTRTDHIPPVSDTQIQAQTDTQSKKYTYSPKCGEKEICIIIIIIYLFIYLFFILLFFKPTRTKPQAEKLG